MNNQPQVDNEGNSRWIQNGQLHRDDDQPAVIKANGTKIWYHGR